MANTNRGYGAKHVYRRTLAEVAETQILAAAEDVVGDVWITALEQLKAGIMHWARELTVPSDGPADDEPSAELTTVCLLLVAVDEELERVCLTGIERSRHVREGLARLHAAHAAAEGR